MIRALLVAALSLAALPLQAQQVQEATTTGTGAVLRGLDKINGNVVDIDIQNGGVARMGGLVIRMRECRYPEGNQAGDAFAFLTVTEPEKTYDTVFEGWMMASAPALNAMDHARYDIWVLRCKSS